MNEREALLKRQESSALGIRTRPVAKLRGPKFAKSERTAAREPKPKCHGMSRIAREYGLDQ